MIPQGRQRAESGHERKDADVIGIALVAALVLLIVAISFLAAKGLLHFAESDQKPQRAASTRMPFPRPRLEVHPTADLAAARKASETELHSYGWIDRGAGVVRIPIERAIQLLTERGLPEVGAGLTPLQLRQARPSMDAQPKHPVGAPTPEGSPP